MRNDAFRRFIKSDEFAAFNEPQKQLEFMEVCFFFWFMFVLYIHFFMFFIFSGILEIWEDLRQKIF